MKSVQIAVIGAGASGLMAARCAALHTGGAVALLEGNPRAGKKLLATGNGRCNLTNRDLSIGHYHGDAGLAEQVLSEYPVQRVLSEFESMGLLCRSDGEGRFYPRNLQAAAVLRALRFSCEEAGVETVCGLSACVVSREKGGFLIRSEIGESLRAKQCILACGGKASPKHSCAGNGYRLAEQFGHRVSPCAPALVQLKCAEKMIRSLKGMRCKARLSLRGDGRELYTESGEVIFSEGALSGICVFNASVLAADWMQAGKAVQNLTLCLDLCEGMDEGDLRRYLLRLKREHPTLPCFEMLSGLVNMKVGEEVVKSVGIDLREPIARLPEARLTKLAERLKGLCFTVTGLGDWDGAQVTAGGIPLREVNLKTMESNKQPGLFLAGELLNVHGDCGGYNLHWAWATGMAAGLGAASK